MSETYGAKALRIALTQVGVKESPPNSNTGPKVKQYQACTQYGGTGWPWCAAFALWSYQKAGAKQPYPSAFVPALVGWYHAHGRGVVGAHVKPGDFVMYDWQRDGTADHVGLFRRWMNRERTEFEAVEGNTALGNDSNGGEVMVRFRHVRDVAMFARPVGAHVPAGTPFDPITGAAIRHPLKKLVWRVKHRTFRNSGVRTDMTYVEPDEK